MTNVHVTVPFFHTDSEGWHEAESSISVGRDVFIGKTKECSPASLHVCEYQKGTSSGRIKQLMSNGMKECHKTAKETMAELFGDDWSARASYRFGEVEYLEEAVLTAAEESYLDSD